MDTEVTKLWAEGVDVTEKTDTDLVASRSAFSQVSDADRRLHQLVASIEAAEDGGRSLLIDRAIRMYIAHIIDTDMFLRDRDDYDIGYVVPPEGWVDMYLPRDIPILDSDDERVTSIDRTIGFSTAPVIREIVDDAVAAEVAPTVSGFVIQALEAYCGTE